jgi:hypothetical protein
MRESAPRDRAIAAGLGPPSRYARGCHAVGTTSPQGAHSPAGGETGGRAEIGVAHHGKSLARHGMGELSRAWHGRA